MNSTKRYRDQLLKPRTLQLSSSINDRDTAAELKNHDDDDDEDSDVVNIDKDRNIVKVGKAMDIEKNITASLPKSIRKDAHQILKFVKSNRQSKLSWNNDKELTYDGRTMHGSNVSDLLLDMLSNRRKLISPAIFGNIFAKGLAEIKLPEEWIRNNKIKDLIHEHGEMSASKENVSIPARAVKKRYKTLPNPLRVEGLKNSPLKSVKWLSSTSSMRV